MWAVARPCSPPGQQSLCFGARPPSSLGTYRTEIVSLLPPSHFIPGAWRAPPSSQCKQSGRGCSLAPDPGSPEEGTGTSAGSKGPQGTHPAPRESTGGTEDQASTATWNRVSCESPAAPPPGLQPHSLGARGEGCYWGRAVGHWRWLVGLGTLARGKPQGLWALLPLLGLGWVLGPGGWDRGRGVSGCTVRGAGGRAHPAQGGLEGLDTDQGLAGGRGLRYLAAICCYLRC